MKQDIHCKEKLQEVTGEYLFYKGIIRGLEEAKNKTLKEITTLQNIYKVKTIKIDKLIGEEDDNS
jgi:hypothetical protein